MNLGQATFKLVLRYLFMTLSLSFSVIGLQRVIKSET